VILTSDRRDSARSTRIHIWVPDYDTGGGGIQEFSRFFVQAVAVCLPGTRVSVFSKNDRGCPTARPAAATFHQSGRWPASLRTVAFATEVVVRALVDRPTFILCTHVHFSPIAAWLKRFAGIRFAAVAHGVEVWNVRRRALRPTLLEADRVFAVSQCTRERMCAEMQLDPGRTAILPDTFDSTRFVPGPKPGYLLKRYGLRHDQPVILTVGRLSREEQYKGYDQILRALPAIRKAVPEARYILVGRGSDRPRVEALVRELDLADAVTLAGFIAPEELCDHYNLCDVFAMPSKGEGFGIVFLEALACGKPVLAGNRDGSVDALLDGELGVLVDPDNVNQIAETIAQILRREHSLQILYEPATLRARVIDAYGFERFRTTVAERLATLGLTETAPLARSVLRPDG
jgi:glycosyltransferase involved in cell wall biosynthesis